MAETGIRPETTERVTRGVMRLLHAMDNACLMELPLANGRRADIVAIDRKGIISIVEVKSSVEDFRSDSKWHEYLPYCDRFFFAIPMDFPVELLPEDAGLVIADAFGAAIERKGIEGEMNASRRKAITIRFARQAATRLHRTIDPDLGPGVI